MGGLARRASVIDTFRNPEHGLVVVDVGDSLLSKSAAAQQPIAAPDLHIAETMLLALSNMDVHALVPGELELLTGLSWLQKTAAAARVPLLGANLRDRRGKRPLPTHRIVETGGVKVGLLGLLDLSVVTKQHQPMVKKTRLRTTDPVAAARAGVKALQKQGAELVVLLGHLGMANARQLAQKVEGIHLLVVGHGGSRTGEPQKVGKTFLLEAGARGRELGHLEIRLGRAWGAGARLADDSRRHRLYHEALAVEKDVRQRLARAKGKDPQKAMEASIQRARYLNEQYRKLAPVSGDHTIIARLVELSDKVGQNPAIKGLVDGRKKLRPAATAPVKPQMMIPTKIKLRPHR